MGVLTHSPSGCVPGCCRPPSLSQPALKPTSPPRAVPTHPPQRIPGAAGKQSYLEPCHCLRRLLAVNRDPPLADPPRPTEGQGTGGGSSTRSPPAAPGRPAASIAPEPGQPRGRGPGGHSPASRGQLRPPPAGEGGGRGGWRGAWPGPAPMRGARRSEGPAPGGAPAAAFVAAAEAEPGRGRPRCGPEGSERRRRGRGEAPLGVPALCSSAWGGLGKIAPAQAVF